MSVITLYIHNNTFINVPKMFRQRRIWNWFFFLFGSFSSLNRVMMIMIMIMMIENAFVHLFHILTLWPFFFCSLSFFSLLYIKNSQLNLYASHINSIEFNTSTINGILRKIFVRLFVCKYTKWLIQSEHTIDTSIYYHW